MASSTVAFPVKDAATKDAINAQFKQLQDKTGKTKTEVLTDLLMPKVINDATRATPEAEDPYASWKDDARQNAQAAIDLVERLCQRFEQREKNYHATHDGTVDDLMQQVARLTAERDDLTRQVEQLTKERDEALQRYETLAKAVEQRKPAPKAKPKRQQRKRSATGGEQAQAAKPTGSEDETAGS